MLDHLRVLPSKPEVIVPVWCDIEWINADFPKRVFLRKFTYSASVKVRNQRILVRNIGFGRNPTSVFEVGFVKNQIQKLRDGTSLPCLRRLQTQKPPEQKITVRFKLNLKTDGLACKIIFKIGWQVERLHSARKQCRRIYICLFCSAKYLLGTPKPVNCILWMQAVLSK